MLVRRLEESTSSSPDWGRVDQFHIGGKVTTNKFLKWLEVGGKKVLDVGCGLGGPARMCIDPPHGCESVIGVDTSKDFVDAAEFISNQCPSSVGGGGTQPTFFAASGEDTNLEDKCVDLCYMIHVGMNVMDVRALAREMRRVVNDEGPGPGVFGVFDVVRVGDGVLEYPVPWAGEGGEGCEVKRWEMYERAFEGEGWGVGEVLDVTEECEGMLRKAVGRGGGEGGGGWGINVVMGENAWEKQANLLRGLEEGVLGVKMGKWKTV